MKSGRTTIVVVDGYTVNPGDNPWDELAELGQLAVFERTSPSQLLERCLPAEVVLTNKVAFTAETMAQLPRLAYIGVTATGYDMVDVKAARAKGIAVTNVPLYGTASVAQFVFALLLELCHHVGLHDRAVHEGEWTRSPDFSFWKSPTIELEGKTMGIVGFGRIGRRVGELAHAFGMKVIACDPRRDAPPPYKPFAWASVEEAFSQADVLSLNCALTGETKGMVNSALLSKMKANAFLINAARGGLVQEGDLAAALDAGQIRGAALDVVSLEPITPDNPLLHARNCIITPHIAWASLESRRRLMQASIDNVKAFLAGKPQNRVD